MKLFVLATLVLLCSAVVHVWASEAKLEVEASSAVALEFQSKVLDRLERQIARRKRLERAAKSCGITIKRAEALIIKTKEQIRIKKVKLGIAQNDVATAAHQSSKWARKAEEFAQEAARIDNRIKLRQSEIDVQVGRLNTEGAEKLALIKLLRKIDARLKVNGLAEIGSELSSAAAAHSDAAVATLLEAAAAKSQSNKGDVQDVHMMIDLLIKQLEAELKDMPPSIKKILALWAQSKATLLAEANSARSSARSSVRRCDAALARSDKAKALVLVLQEEIKALGVELKATRANLKITRERCAWEQKRGAKTQAAARRQIKVLKQVIAMLQNRKLSQQIVGLIQDVKLDLPVWQKGAWSACSAKCGLGKQTRAVACSAKKCLGNKPRTTRLCNLGPCKADCIVSAWTSWSECSAKCGGGVKTSTRKILARPQNGGKACPSSLGLQRQRACNTRACPITIPPAEVAKRAAQQKALADKIALANQRIAALKVTDANLHRKLDNLQERLRNAQTQEEFDRLARRARQLVKQEAQAEKKIGQSSFNRFRARQQRWSQTPAGKQAKEFCLTLANKGTPSFRGCMQDMRMTKGNKEVASAAVRETQQTIKKNQRAIQQGRVAVRNGGTAPARTCTANGDPHQTNFNGVYFHVQVPGIYTYARSDDGAFVVQGKQDGSTGAGSPSYMRSCKIRYNGQVYDNVLDKDGFKVNCLNTQLTITVPGAYQDRMQGLCGTNSLNAGAHNYRLPDGSQADVDFGKPNWQMGGYGGRFTKLSQWALSWRPSARTCMYSQAECTWNMGNTEQPVQQQHRQPRVLRTRFGAVNLRPRLFNRQAAAPAPRRGGGGGGGRRRG